MCRNGRDQLRSAGVGRAARPRARAARPSRRCAALRWARLCGRARGGHWHLRLAGGTRLWAAAVLMARVQVAARDGERVGKALLRGARPVCRGAPDIGDRTFLCRCEDVSAGRRARALRSRPVARPSRRSSATPASAPGHARARNPGPMAERCARLTANPRRDSCRLRRARRSTERRSSFSRAHQRTRPRRTSLISGGDDAPRERARPTRSEACPQPSNARGCQTS